MSSMLERITAAQNAHDAELFASYFADDYPSDQPAHPGRAFVGSAQVRTNWAAVFAGVPDFRAELVAQCVSPDGAEWGELAWNGHHVDGSVFAMRGVMVLTLRADLITAARLFMEPLEQADTGIDAAVEELYRAPSPPDSRS